MMINCPECGAQFYPGTLFCDMCGAAIHPAAKADLAASKSVAGQKSSVTIVRPRDLMPESAPTARPIGLVTPPVNQSRALRVNIVHHQTEMILRATLIQVGRTDPFSDFVPELDLSRFGGQERGVSRRHATIQWIGDELVISDSHSSNGTWLNGKRLDAGKTYSIPPNAYVRFGGLLVQLSPAD